MKINASEPNHRLYIYRKLARSGKVHLVITVALGIGFVPPDGCQMQVCVIPVAAQRLIGYLVG